MARAPKKKATKEATEGDRFTLELDPDPELGFGPAADDHDDEAIDELYLESVETVATIDAIEPDGEEDLETDRYRITLHASVSEAAAQQLFAAFVRKGKVRIALLPADDDERFAAEP